MKVLCIKEPNNKTNSFGISILEVGEEYNVVGEHLDKDREMFYELLEHPSHVYMATLFVPLEDNYAEDVLEQIFEPIKTKEYERKTVFARSY